MGRTRAEMNAAAGRMLFAVGNCLRYSQRLPSLQPAGTRMGAAAPTNNPPTPSCVEEAGG